MLVKMRLVKRSDGWWIIGVPECEECGPYGTKAEADDDRRGLERSYKELGYQLTGVKHDNREI